MPPRCALNWCCSARSVAWLWMNHKTKKKTTSFFSSRSFDTALDCHFAPPPFLHGLLLDFSDSFGFTVVTRMIFGCFFQESQNHLQKQDIGRRPEKRNHEANIRLDLISPLTCLNARRRWRRLLRCTRSTARTPTRQLRIAERRWRG